ncbi:MAG: 16S rRNA (cytosine(967)-C(5))-methyltransferase RsmB [bacterium]|uniref:16S rRNA (cytosine(967)-C(5))-methyltransferase n=1 Tax=Candidatus Methylomirabilis tolerans TaxID=3123416 RepID=A0AAJ1AHR2_9BACT|nr:16S rRNA (cytosine(967)-C(5))-methyltransferase RsmB [Candidatus Methylomirabilis sp.]
MRARRLAFEILTQVEEQQAYASLLLDAKLKQARLSQQDRALATELTYGVLRWQGRLDYLLAAVTDRSWSKVDRPLRHLLRLGAYQILFLTRIPAYAAVNETVALTQAVVRGHATPGAKAFINAILRRLLERHATIRFPDPSGDPVGALAARWSHPSWLVTRWLKRLETEETEALLQANNETPALSVMVNRLKRRPEEVEERLTRIAGSVTPGRFVPGAFHLKDGAEALRDPAFADGWYFPMDEAAALPVLMLDPQPGDVVLDACAGGGGKTALLLGRLGGHGRVIALDPSARAHRRLQEARVRLGLDRVSPVQADARQAAQLFTRPVDRILVDAPCSGLGTLRRHPERRWQQQEAGLAALARLQLELLHGVAPVLKPGGSLVYSTCSLEPEETDVIVETFLRHFPEFVAADTGGGLPATVADLIDSKGALRTWPHRHGLDGFYAIRLRRRNR